MINRASRELYIENKQEFRDEHIQLISEFLSSHKVNDYTRFIFKRIPEYVSSVPTAWVFSARNQEEELVAFDIAEFGVKEYVFYMFNFISRQCYVPGTSDLLLYKVIKAARKQGKSFINLGLRINEGITFFKKKWGGVSFVDYEFCLYTTDHMKGPKSLLQKL